MPSLLAIRDPLADAKDTLSSWDKCMAKNYCKWPVIVAIIVGSLVVLSVVLCVARCICCGAECACCCFKCCAGCCGSGRKGHKRMNSTGPPPVYPSSSYNAVPPAPPVDQQYRSHAAPTAVPTYRGVEPERPQFAKFESPSKPVNEDALPAMPSWGEAKSTHVEEVVVPEKRGDMEMERLDHNGSMTGSSVTAAAVAGGVAGGARRSPGRSPLHQSPTHDDYGFPQGYQNDSFVGAAPHRNSPGPQGGQYRRPQDPYRGGSPAQNLSPVNGAGAGPGFNQNQQYGRKSPNRSPIQGPGYINGYNQGYGQQQYNRPPQQRSPVREDPYDNTYGAPNDYRQADRRPSPSSDYNDYALVSAPAPAPVKSHTPAYANSSPTNYEAPAPSPTPAPSYPGQQTYQPEAPSYPGQPAYRAFSPAQNEQHSGVQRKAVDGSWKEV
ncbi:hypothetical protein BDV96DRAFT_572943 [Lophiotrema nucula]|uniref:Fibroin-3 related protein n=1 Tax=Lophiotrema nucula TaxID=690887 RepID=A0A6A5ZEE3_9PLEO|nr:hypothetical protein BDV96DRAFT_572943 [Lophiotrema nucula]